MRLGDLLNQMVEAAEVEQLSLQSDPRRETIPVEPPPPFSEWQHHIGDHISDEDCYGQDLICILCGTDLGETEWMSDKTATDWDDDEDGEGSGGYERCISHLNPRCWRCEPEYQKMKDPDLRVGRGL